MTRLSIPWALAGGLVVALVAVAVRVPSGGVTQRRVEDAFARTFANLVAVQVARMGAAPVEPVSLHAFAQCKKVGAMPRETRGPGDWACDVGWYVPGQRAPVHDTYDLSVTADGCYAATADAEAHIGGPTVTSHGGATLRNLLYAFDGCFDVTK